MIRSTRSVFVIGLSLLWITSCGGGQGGTSPTEPTSTPATSISAPNPKAPAPAPTPAAPVTPATSPGWTWTGPSGCIQASSSSDLLWALAVNATNTTPLHLTWATFHSPEAGCASTEAGAWSGLRVSGPVDYAPNVTGTTTFEFARQFISCGRVQVDVSGGGTVGLIEGMVLNFGHDCAVIPNIVGMTQAAATAAITGSGLVVGPVTTVMSSSVPAGSVISQSPSRGGQVEPGTIIAFVVATVPAPPSSGAAASLDVCNVFWQVGSAATLNGSNFPGIVVAQAGVTLGVNASVAGKALATAGPVTLSGVDRVSGCPGFAVLGSAGVTAAGGVGTVIGGAVGSSPSASITGFPPATALGVHPNDASAIAQQAADVALFTALSVGACTDSPGAQLNGASFGPGIHCFASAVDLAGGGTFTLTGSGVYIFRVPTALTANVGSTAVY
jgi:hypothetical protein